MPYVSMFFGIIIRMFYSEHNPPHFHAEYQGSEGIFNFEGEMLRGNKIGYCAETNKGMGCFKEE